MLLQDLLADLKSELSGSLAKLILGLMLTPAQYDAKQLRKAVEVIATLLVSVPAWEDKVVFAVAVPTLLVSRGCEHPQLHMPQGLISYREEKIRKYQDKDLVCTQDFLRVLFGLFAAQHAQPAGSHRRARVGANQ